ncbi:MAG: purine-nucleoside phosphorylase [Oscillospiraceae bacterium]|jgi:purine-nucleoside phosphorylase|nr:purine-nucleoside phosphorylase [Oscillospiraceae bacterium]
MKDGRMEKLLRCRDSVRKVTSFEPRLALVLGSGLGGLADSLELAAAIDYADIDGFPVSTVAGHEGRLLFGRLAGRDVVCMQGRVHYYEGYDVSDVVLPVRLMGLLGAGILFLTNAAGSLNLSYEAGDLMMIRDHVMTFFPANPLRGPNLDGLGPRFPDMTNIYDDGLCDIIRACADERGIALREGVYVQLPGPSYETPAEIRFLGRCCGDAVGMSTACEAVAARHMGMKVCGVSCITNKGAGISPVPLTHEEVGVTAALAAEKFKALITAAVERMLPPSGGEG